MDWAEFNAARQYLAEERVGRRLRESGAEEDDEFAASLQALRRG